MTLAAVLPQVVGALRAFDPYERGVALNQLAQVCELSFARGVQIRQMTRPLIPLTFGCGLPGRLLPRPASAWTLHAHTCICTPHGCMVVTST